MDWQCEEVELTGDLPDLDGNVLKETVELWYRNPLDCIQELLSNPAFREVMKYAPERHYVDAEGKTRVINEMWTADWWWELQVCPSSPGLTTQDDNFVSNAYHREQPLPPSFCPQTKPSCRSSVVTKARGPSI